MCGTFKYGSCGVAKGELKIVKVGGEENAPDGLTKRMDRQKMEQYMKACGMVRRSGRHELSPQLGDRAWAFFISETVRAAVFCPNGRWRHLALARFAGDSSVIHDPQRQPWTSRLFVFCGDSSRR